MVHLMTKHYVPRCWEQKRVERNF
ncbi:hypothetical protein LINPERPRIM_LOCUS21452 [Linum perenne]